MATPGSGEQDRLLDYHGERQRTDSNPAVVGEEARKFETQLESFKQMRVLIVGKSGVGKSSFLNGLFQANMATVGRVKPETSAVTDYDIDLTCGVKIKVYDTPGFGADKKLNKKFIKEIRKTCELVDVNFLCIRMDDQLRVEDKQTIALLAKEFDVNFWKKTLIVFTRANMVKPMSQHSRKSSGMYLREVRDELKSEVEAVLEQAKITAPLFVMAGAPESTPEGRMIPSIDGEQDDDSETQIDWLPAVAIKIFESGCSETAKAVLLKSGWGKWAHASAGSGAGSIAGTAVGTMIVVAGIATLPIPPVGIVALAIGGTMILVSLVAGAVSTASFGATAAVTQNKTKRKINEAKKEVTKTT